MTVSDLSAVLDAAGVGKGIGFVKGIIADTSYSLPAREWLAGEFAQSFKRNLSTLGLSAWENNRWDCDKFALLASALMKIEHARTSKAQTGIAFGYLGYYPETFPPAGHSINFAVVANAGRHELVFFEPQNQQIVELSADEISSIFFYVI